MKQFKAQTCTHRIALSHHKQRNTTFSEESLLGKENTAVTIHKYQQWEDMLSNFAQHNINLVCLLAAKEGEIQDLFFGDVWLLDVYLIQ